MSAINNPVLTNLTLADSSNLHDGDQPVKVYSKGVDLTSSTADSSSLAGTSTVWSLTDHGGGDYELSGASGSFGQHAEARHIEVAPNTNIQMNTAPSGWHQQMWQIDSYLADGSVVHKQGGGNEFTMTGGLPAGTVFAELMLGPVPGSVNDGNFPDTETLANIIVQGASQTELFYVDTSISQDGSSFGLLLDGSSNPVTRSSIESGLDVSAVKVAPVDYQVPANTVNWTYPAPTSEVPYGQLGLSSTPPDFTDTANYYYYAADGKEDPNAPISGTGAVSNTLDLTHADLAGDAFAILANVGFVQAGDDIIQFNTAARFDTFIVSGETDQGTATGSIFVGNESANNTVIFEGGFGVELQMGTASHADTIVFEDQVTVSLETITGSGRYDHSFDVSNVNYISTDPDTGPEYLGGGDISGVDYILGSEDGDTITVSNVDAVVGFGGDDTITAGIGTYTVLGGAGDDTITASADTDFIAGGAGDDTIYGSDGYTSQVEGSQSTSNPGFQTHVILGGAGDDTITGGDASELIFGGDGADTIDGGKGDDILVSGGPGGSYDDLVGGEGDDVLIVSPNGVAIDLHGNEGDDIFVLSEGSDASIDGGAGINDIVLQEGSTSAIYDLKVSGDELQFNPDTYQDRLTFNIAGSTISGYAAGLGIAADSSSWTSADRATINSAVSTRINYSDGAYHTFDIELVLSYLDTDGVTGKTAVLASTQLRQSKSLETFSSATQRYETIEVDAFTPPSIMAPAVHVETDLRAKIQETEWDRNITTTSVESFDPTAELSDLYNDFFFSFGIQKVENNTITGDGSSGILTPFSLLPEQGVRYRPSEADEVLVGTKNADTYQLKKQQFNDGNGPQSFGRDVIIDLNGDGDSIQIDTTLSEGLLSGDVVFTRKTVGDELSGETMNISTASGATFSNAINLDVYKQFNPYTDFFAVETVDLVDISLQIATQNDMDEQIATESGTAGHDAMLFVGRDNQIDDFWIYAGETSDGFEAYFASFDTGSEYDFITLDGAGVVGDYTKSLDGNGNTVISNGGTKGTNLVEITLLSYDIGDSAIDDIITFVA